jgi:hypothetical protein
MLRMVGSGRMILTSPSHIPLYHPMRQTCPATPPPPPFFATPAMPPPGPREGETLPEVHVPRALLPRESRSGQGDPPPSGKRAKRLATVWVGSSSTGADFVVLVDKGAVVRVWAVGGVMRLGAIDEAVTLGADGGEARVRVVVDASTAAGRMLASAVRERVGCPVEQVLPDRTTMGELRMVIDQGSVVHHLQELAKVARVSRHQAVRVASSLVPALEEMQRPMDRAASIPQTPPPPPWRRAAMWTARAVGLVLCVALGVLVASQATAWFHRAHLSLGK